MASIDLIIVPYDSGRRGWRMGAGPEALLDGGLADALADAGHGAATTPVGSTSPDPLASAVEHAVQVADAVRRARSAGRFPIVLAGNCIATVGAFAGAHGPGSVLAWFDAHADLNTPDTSTSGFLDGMAAATLLGWCHQDAFARVSGQPPLAPDRLLLIGGRSFDPAEQDVLARGTVQLVPPDAAHDDVACSARLNTFARGTDGAWVHLDLDVLDPVSCGPANVFATPDGLRIDAVERILRVLAAATPLTGMSVTAYDPAVDASGSVRAAAFRLLHVAADAVS